jgi:hypothetical protein
VYIKEIDFYAWRHSLRQLRDFPFNKYSNVDDVRELTRKSLKNEDVARWMDILLNRDDGYHNTLSSKSTTSNISRQLDYVSKILISTVIKNDIGLRGGISPIFNCSINNSLYNSTKSIELPSDVHFINTSMDKFSSWSLIKLRKNRDDYVIPYSTDTSIIVTNDKLIEQIRCASHEIIHGYFEKGDFAFDCAFFSIDFFICDGIAIPFECHFPGRGFGLHLLPFFFEPKTKNSASCIIESLKRELANLYGGSVELIVKSTGASTFHALDRLLVSMLSESDSRNRKTIGLEVGDNLLAYQKRDDEIKCMTEHQMIITKPINENDLCKIKTFLGNWIVLKTRMNTPWWSQSRRKPEILIVDENLIHRANYILQINGEIILQKLITDSQDIHGHCGELRVHYLIAR